MSNRLAAVEYDKLGRRAEAVLCDVPHLVGEMRLR
jgi:hypothetical protein